MPNIGFHFLEPYFFGELPENFFVYNNITGSMNKYIVLNIMLFQQ